MSTQQHPNIWRLLSESTHIIGAQPRHFSALSLLFILPISLAAAVIYPFFLQPNDNSSTPSQFTTQILYLLFALVFGLCNGASITYTTSRGFYGKTVYFISSLKCILVSFLPLLATKLVAHLVMGLIICSFGVFMLLAYNGLLLIGVEMDYDSQYFLLFVILIAALLVAVLFYLQVGWCLATAVVVVESRWGLAALKRSWYLVKGMRWVVFSMMLLFGVFAGILSVWYSAAVMKAAGGGNGGSGWSTISWGFGLEMIVCANFWTILSLYSTTATTVLFIYCKASHGEDMAAFQIDYDEEEFGRDYVPLSFDVV